MVLATGQKYEPNWPVSSAGEAAKVIAAAGGRVAAAPEEAVAGKLAAAEHPSGTVPVLPGLPQCRYVADSRGMHGGLASAAARHRLRPRHNIPPAARPGSARWLLLPSRTGLGQARAVTTASKATSVISMYVR